jgi:signal transduction histidine kinase
MSSRAPTLRQLVGLGITLAAVAIFSLYTQRQINGLRRIATDTVDRNRRDSLQLIRIQNDLNQLGLSLRDMSEGTEPYPLLAYRAEMTRVKADLEDALAAEAKLTPANRSESQQALLRNAFARFWAEADQVWALAGQNRENEARSLVRTRMEAARATMSTLVARLLILNSEAEAEGFREIVGIYDRVERNLYYFLAAVLAAIAVNSLYVIRFNRRIFQQLATLSEERGELAARVIGVQEDVFRTLARELHDDLGQVLTALGMMLQRVEKRFATEEAARRDLREVREIANQTLERVRGMSQMLHPPVLDDYGLARSIDWYIEQYCRQTGLTVHRENEGTAPWIGDKVAIHVYRILQESLNNVVRHSKTMEAWVKTVYTPLELRLEVRDEGRGLPDPAHRKGFGLIAMRERAELLQGTIVIERAAAGGTRVALRVPLTTEDS